VVTEFDDDRGLGSVLDDDGRRYPFHCATIVDGTRTVEVGMRVAFAVVPGHRGRYEARSITGIGSPPHDT
jgi:cold shock CspA family protein